MNLETILSSKYKTDFASYKKNSPILLTLLFHQQTNITSFRRLWPSKRKGINKTATTKPPSDFIEGNSSKALMSFKPYPALATYNKIVIRHHVKCSIHKSKLSNRNN